jgi:translation initiation factor IF-3
LNKKPLANNRIRADKVRLVNEEGKQVGIFSLEEALSKARERNLDLVQVTEKVEPPICKIIDYGKYLYQLQKKEKKPQKSTEVKGIRLRFNISDHDLETRARQAQKFLEKGDLIKIDMVLFGRQKGLTGFAREKINHFIKVLEENFVIKIEKPLKRARRGFTMVVSGTKKQEEEEKENENID